MVVVGMVVDILGVDRAGTLAVGMVVVDTRIVAGSLAAGMVGTQHVQLQRQLFGLTALLVS